MNDFVLRGFCKKCEWPIALEDGMIKGLHEVLDSDTGLSTNPIKCNDHKMEPIWFLSARQMQIVFGSDEFEKWAGQENYFELCNNAFTLIVKVLEEHPFLVSKILKDAGEKNKEENK